MVKKIIFVLIALALVLVIIRVCSKEDTWVCSGGQWVKHGNPKDPQPTDICPGGALGETLDAKVFFLNPKLDPGAQDCSIVYPVNRHLSYTGSKYEAIIKDLLSGPKEGEQSQGFASSINVGIAMPKVSYTDGVITLDFAIDFQTGVAGSCRVAAIRSQLINTLTQFAEVQEVVISVNGDSETALQP